jgi:thymidylate synthase
MKQYLELLKKVLDEGVESEDRTGTGTFSIFGEKLEFDLKLGFPMLTTKRLSFKNIATELLWFISGKEDASFLKQHGNTIWDEWMEYLSPTEPMLYETYGKQWRDFSDLGDDAVGNGIDQLANVINQIITNPNSRRLIVSAWNPLTVEYATLPPCHILFQFYVRNGELSCSFTMRSTDVFLGLPYNIASYALLTHLIADLTGLKVGKLVYFGNDVHLYKNHLEQARTQLKRDPQTYALPQLKINRSVETIDDYTLNDFELIGYEAHQSIKADVSV